MRGLAKLLLVPLVLVAGRAGAQTITLTHATVIDTVTGGTTPDATVVIRGNRIVSVARAAAASGGTVVDAKGRYLIPGLWDMHTHVYFDRTAADGSELILPSFIANGVTGIRDMGSELDAVLHARDEVAAHRLLGPRMIVSGPMLDGPKSQYKAAIAIATADDGRKAVDLLKRRGVDFVKVQSGIPRAAYLAIAEESKKVGLPFEGHVPDAIRAREAIAAGQRSFEHLIGIFEASSPDEDKYLTGKKTPGMFLATYDPAREARIIALLAERQVWQCPTLFWERGQWLVDAIDYTRDPDLAFAGRGVGGRVAGTRSRSSPPSTPIRCRCARSSSRTSSTSFAACTPRTCRSSPAPTRRRGSTCFPESACTSSCSAWSPPASRRSKHSRPPRFSRRATGASSPTTARCSRAASPISCCSTPTHSMTSPIPARSPP